MKKLLALVLALVMSMSLVTISNAAYSDKADIDLKEAVDVLSAVGVFEGSDGKFDPKANLTREQAAKLVADPMYYGVMMVKMGDADGLVSGAIHSTGDMLRPALQIIKSKPGIKTVSSCFLM